MLMNIFYRLHEKCLDWLVVSRICNITHETISFRSCYFILLSVLSYTGSVWIRGSNYGAVNLFLLNSEI